MDRWGGGSLGRRLAGKTARWDVGSLGRAGESGGSSGSGGTSTSGGRVWHVGQAGRAGRCGSRGRAAHVGRASRAGDSGSVIIATSTAVCLRLKFCCRPSNHDLPTMSAPTWVYSEPSGTSTIPAGVSAAAGSAGAESQADDGPCPPGMLRTLSVRLGPLTTSTEMPMDMLKMFGRQIRNQVGCADQPPDSPTSRPGF